MSSMDNGRAVMAGLARTHHMSEGAIAHLLDGGAGHLGGNRQRVRINGK